jgi:DNA topoisomerase-6 subunit B
MMEAHYQKGTHSVDMYLKLTAIANPHVNLQFQDPHGDVVHYRRSTDAVPPRPTEIKPHPRGVELGQLIQMLNNTDSRTLRQFLENEFSRVGSRTAKEIIHQAGKNLSARSYPRRIAHHQASALYRAIKRVKVSAPPTDCLVPIGETRLLEGLRKEIDAEYYVVVTRPPAVYRGNPFQVEAAIAYGRPPTSRLEVNDSGHITKTTRRRHDATRELVTHSDDPARLLRFANRVPLLYEQGGCAISQAVIQTNWRQYGLQQPKGALPVAPMAILVHVASVWVPFTSEAKEALAAYPEILTELKLGLQNCGRKLATHLRHDARLKREYEKRTYIEQYLPHIGMALQDMLNISDEERQHTIANLDILLEQHRKI